jgi:replication factor C small subunit
MFENLWVEKYRPLKLVDLILSPENRKFFEDIKTKQEIPHLLLCGVQGSGKSSLAKITVRELLDCQYLYINASSENGIDTMRNKISNFVSTMSIDNKLKVVIFDEADFLTAGAQAGLRNIMEEFSDNSRFILTGNYYNRLIGPIQSRCLQFELIPPLDGCIKRCVSIIKAEDIKVENGQKERLINLIKVNYPDLRSIINELQKYSINGILNIPKDLHTSSSIVKDIFNKLNSQEDIIKIRKFIIENEILFVNDFHSLLKELFEIFYKEENIDLNKKKRIMLILSEALFRHQTVLDKEINCFASLIEISEVLK